MSEHEAYLRMYAARTGRRFPVIFEMLERGEIHLTAVDKLGPHLTEQNHRALLESAIHKTKRQIEELLAQLFPQPAVTESIRKLPVKPAMPVLLPKQRELAPAVQPPAVRETIAPLSPERYAIRFTASARCRELLDRAKQLMSHRSPNADAADLFEAGLEALVEKLEKQKFKMTSRPRQRTTANTDSHHIPAAVARAVHARDGGGCTFLGPDGHRCDCRSFLEFDHILPVAKGGKSTLDNLRLRCRAHNQLTARLEFGDDYVALRAQGLRPVNNAAMGEHARGDRSSHS